MPPLIDPGIGRGHRTRASNAAIDVAVVSLVAPAEEWAADARRFGQRVVARLER